MLQSLRHITNGIVQWAPSTKTFPTPLISLTRRLSDNSVVKKDEGPPSETAPFQESPPAASEEFDKLYKTVELEMRAYEPSVLKSYSWFTTTAAKELGIKVGECWAVKKPDHDRFSLLKSIHIYKKHQVQYEVRTYFRFAKFHCLTSSTADTFLEYIERNLPEGVGLKVTKVAIERLPDHIKAPTPMQLEQ
ncbi:small ribosomal subunit protein uS10m [Hetaerina americana]|uniref:small ribosomal subunit protein uS10m n=1 Tax=Hetaerina americana TaxID=62018 RepID=UPI003A7F102F